MAISGITGYDYSQMAVQGINAIDQTQQTAQAAQVAATGSGSDQANFSQVSQLLSQLYQLQTTDPDKFKTVTQQISNDLASQAQQAGSTGEAAVLGALSQRFEQISQSGDLTSGVQSKRQGHHHHRNGYGAGGQAKGSGIAELLGTVNNVISTDLAALTASATSTATQTAAAATTTTAATTGTATATGTTASV